jgi:hypothetical protein
MGKIVQPGEVFIDGPWLISQEAFESLQKVIDFVDDKLKQSLESEMNNAIEELKERESDQPTARINARIALLKDRKMFGARKRFFAFVLDDENEIQGTSLIDLIKDVEKHKASPLEFKIVLQYGVNNLFQIQNIETKDDEGIEYKIRCADESIRDEILEEIRKWVEKYRSDTATHLWTYLGTFMILVGIVWLLIVSAIFIPDDRESYESAVSKEARSLLDSGVNSSNISLAVELGLKLATKYKPHNYVGKEIPKTDKGIRWFCYGSFIFLLGITRPKTTIGLGQTRNRLKRYEGWKRIMKGVIFLPLAAELILKFFGL